MPAAEFRRTSGVSLSDLIGVHYILVMRYRLLVITACLVVLIFDSVACAYPPVFTRGTFEQAMEWSLANEDKVLVVSFTATWCGPCKRMDADAWRDRRVESLVRGSGFAVKVDVDRRRDLATRYEAGRVPTTMLVRRGEEIGRHVGYLNADDALAWLARESDGGNTADDGVAETRATAETLAEGVEDVRELMERDAGRAAARAVEVWRSAGTALARDWAGVSARRTLSRAIVRGLDTGDTRAQAEALRAELLRSGNGLDPGQRRDRFMELWVALSVAVGDEAGVAAWFDGAYPPRRRLQLRLGLAAELADALARAGRWADAGRVLGDAGALAEREAAIAAMAEDSERVIAWRAMAGRVGRVHAALVSSRQLRQAWVLVDDVLSGSRDGSSPGASGGAALDDVREAMIRSAIDAGVAQPRHRKLLSEIGRDVTQLRADLDAAL